MTYYNTRRGVTEEPITVDLIHYRGERLGHLGAFDTMTFTWSDRAAGTATLTLPLTPLTVLLLPCDGTVLIAARINGKTHLSTVVKATAEGGEDPATATIKITSADGWTLLDGEIWDPPGPTDPENPDENTVTGSLETIIKNLLYVGVTRAGHPVLIAPDQKRGPTVTVTMTRGDNIAEAVQELLTGTGYRLAMDAWLPGDSPVSGLSPSWPLVVADVVPYRRRDGLIWSVEGRDVPSWSMTQSRATVTDVTVVNKPEKEQNRFSWSASTHPESWWATRCEWLTTDGPKPLGENDLDPFAVQEVLAAEAADHLSQSAAAAELDVEIAPGTTWEFGVDGYTPLQFDVGDYATVTLPVIGNIAQVVTDVEVTITPTEFTVTPTVSTPDTTPVAGFANTTGLDRRLKKIERK